MLDDRRDSPRVLIPAALRPLPEAGAPEQVRGDLSLGGFAWEGTPRAPGVRMELQLALPEGTEALVFTGEVMDALPREQGRALMRLRFFEASVDRELQLARYLQAAGPARA